MRVFITLLLIFQVFGEQYHPRHHHHHHADRYGMRLRKRSAIQDWQATARYGGYEKSASSASSSGSAYEKSASSASSSSSGYAPASASSASSSSSGYAPASASSASSSSSGYAPASASSASSSSSGYVKSASSASSSSGYVAKSASSASSSSSGYAPASASSASSSSSGYVQSASSASSPSSGSGYEKGGKKHLELFQKNSKTVSWVKNVVNTITATENMHRTVISAAIAFGLTFFVYFPYMNEKNHILEERRLMRLEQRRTNAEVAPTPPVKTVVNLNIPEERDQEVLLDEDQDINE